MLTLLRSFVILGFCLFSFLSVGQEQINGSFPFLTDPSKDYSIYLPSGYVVGKEIAAFVALHPWNTQNWDGRRWCEEISDFAEHNNVILICPDGGADGQIDDPIDTAFTTVMIDSAMTWYTIAPDSLYAMGFSWGGKTTYTYGLNHVEKFAGFMPIGAAISVDEINGISDRAFEKPFYLIHGANDSPNTRYYPLIDRLENEGAIVESILMPGIGHTIWFPNQVEILTEGFNWLKENTATVVSVEDFLAEETKLLSKENYAPGMRLSFNVPYESQALIYTLDGSLIAKGSTQILATPLESGIYIISIGSLSQKFVVIE